MELLTVILIMSMIVGFSVPRFSRSFGQLQVQVFTNDVVKLLAYASRRAVTRREILSVHIDAEARRTWVAEGRADSQEVSPRVASKLNRLAPIPETVSVTSSAGEVTFYPDGRADPFEMVIVDKSADGYRLVTDVWTGRARISETHGR